MVPQLYAFLIPSYTCLPFTYSSLAWPLFLSTPKKTVPVLQPLGVLMFLVSSQLSHLSIIITPSERFSEFLMSKPQPSLFFSLSLFALLVSCIAFITVLGLFPLISVTKSCLILWDPMDCSTPGLPVHYQLLELAQMHIHRVGDAIQPSHPVFRFSSCLQSFPASVLAANIQDWLPLGFTLSTPSSPRDSQESSQTLQFRSINSSALSFLYSPALTSIHNHWKTIALTGQTFVGKVMSLLFNMLSRLFITFLPRSKYLLISLAAITICSDFGVQKKKVSHCFLIYLPWSDGTGCLTCVLTLILMVSNSLPLGR